MSANNPVNIDFKKLAKSFREYVRNKAMEAGSTIVYVSNGRLVEEDPKTNKIKVLIESFNSK